MITIIGSLYTAILLITVPTHLLSIQDASGCNRRLLAQDSIVLAASIDPIVIKEDIHVSSIQLKAGKQHSFNKSKTFCLLMVGIDLKQPPEGVYEIYLALPNINPANLVSESPYFIDVLNTYTIRSSEGKDRICIDVTKQLSTLNKSNSYLLNYIVTILFRGNLKPDNNSARNAGVLSIDSIQLLQTNKM